MDIQLITAPLIGGMIGLITNSLAIKMLFRPYKEIRIAGIHVPFTPGLIPKEKPRIAHAIAKVIASYILDQDTILAALASDSIKEAYEKKYHEKFVKWKATDLTFEEILSKYELLDTVNAAELKISDSVSSYLIETCRQEQLARKLIENAFESLKSHMNSIVFKMGKKALNAAKDAMIEQAEEMIQEHGKEYVSKYADSIYKDCLGKTVREAAEYVEQNVPDLKQKIWDQYTELVQNKFGKFVATLDVQSIIERKINDYDLNELENMIMEISKKELNALVWLGGLLGVIMGFVNLLF